jgi:hypothetical protein
VWSADAASEFCADASTAQTPALIKKNKTASNSLFMVLSSSEKSLVRLDEHCEKTALTSAQVLLGFDSFPTAVARGIMVRSL